MRIILKPHFLFLIIFLLLVFSVSMSCSERSGLPLLYASRDGDIEQVKKHIADGINVNWKDRDGVSALALAAQNGHLDVMKILLANGANVNATDIFGTPLQAAALKNHIEAAKLLIDNGADVKRKGLDGGTALTQAVIMGYEKMVLLLAMNGAKEYRFLSDTRSDCESRSYRDPNGELLIIGGCSKTASRKVITEHYLSVERWLKSPPEAGKVKICQTNEFASSRIWEQSANKAEH